MRLDRLFVVLVFLGAGCAKKGTIDSPTPTPGPESAPSSAPSPAPPPSAAAAEAPANGTALRRALETRIHFDFDRWDLTPVAQSLLRDKAAVLTTNPAIMVRIEGHADERGSDEYNIVLSSRRAAEAKRFLVGLAVDPSRLEIQGLGEEQPLDPASTEGAWATNRRAEFRITGGLPGGA